MTKHYTNSLFATGEETENISGGHVVRIAFDSGADTEFDYVVPDILWPVGVGQRLRVPFGRGNKPVVGFCVAIIDAGSEQKARRFRLKAVKEVLDAEPLIDSALMELARWISNYYVCPLGQVLAAIVPAAVKKGAGVKTETYVYLTPANESESQHITSKKQRAIVDILKDAKALDAECGIAKSQLLEQADCTAAPLKQLVLKGIAALEQKEIIKALPVVPEGLTQAHKPVELNDDQVRAMDHINSQIESNRFGITMLHGVTDSGKTEVYIRAIEKAIEMGKSAIILLPEIALTAQTVQRFKSRFDRLAILHSQLKGPQRNSQWRKIKDGQADVVIGARSAIFAPLNNLGLVVVDEEHEASYKQDTVPRYNGRDVAIKRAQLAAGHCLLGSATPSLETLHNCQTKDHYTLVELPRRVMDLPMPQMKLVDMSTAFSGSPSKGVHLLSPLLEKQLKEVIARKEQAILLLNRRGYSNFVYCPSCRHTLHCQNCDVTLTFHKKKNVGSKETFLGRHISSGFAICHYCLSKTLVPQKCPLCSKNMTMIGLGSQRLMEELADKFPHAKVRRVDSDAMAGADPQQYYSVLRDFSDGKIDILAGTQMLAKGLHFPNVTLVGVISADTSLALPDFRANERTFQLISQVAGRAGRSEKQGTVIVQTLLPGQPAIQFALEHDFQGFIEAELGHRQKCNLPPYWRMAIIRMRDTKFDRLNAASVAMKQQIDGIIGHCGLEIIVRGPMPAAISRIHQFHRMQIILQAPSVGPLSTFFTTLRISTPIRPAVKIAYDIDPINLL